ncbi:uncharacterized protein G2W53_038670 [Senna tora]|uniref:Uncharacterized protein n=1 Tax=Senna tora TaxID=362788 RepID=A0A834W738_9FABA|nr:uncharacterized protein G2W53_038670 [Senna tora]
MVSECGGMSGGENNAHYWRGDPIGGPPG